MSPPAKRTLSGLAIAAAVVLSVFLGRRGLASIQAGSGAIKIIEYSDYQCPACRRAQPALNKLLDYYGEKVEFVHKHYPLRMHRWSRNASHAAVCADKQGRFKAYNDLLFDRQAKWSKSNDAPSIFQGYAKELGLNVESFTRCANSASTAAEVQADVEEGHRLRVRSTPTYFIAGERLAGGLQLSHRGGQIIEKQVKERGE